MKKSELFKFQPKRTIWWFPFLRSVLPVHDEVIAGRLGHVGRIDLSWNKYRRPKGRSFLLKASVTNAHGRICFCQDLREDPDSRQPGLHPLPLHPHRHPGEGSNEAGSLLLHHHGDHLVHKLWVLFFFFFFMERPQFLLSQMTDNFVSA